MIDLRTCSADDLLADLEPGCAALVHADPPWSYSNAAPPGHGRIDGHYDGATLEAIAATFDEAFNVAKPSAYALLWTTWPFIEPWIVARVDHDRGQETRGWVHLTGGAWRKDDTRRGIGHHLLGDCEPFLLYRKGKPRPQDGPISNALNWPRRAHSAKPLEPLADLLRMATPPGGLVVDLYAGESGSLARACMLTGRRYVGAELDPARADAARRIIEAVRT